MTAISRQSPTQKPSAHWQSDRIVTICHDCVYGNIAKAELALQDWQHEPDCPTAATALLGACLAQRGAYEHASFLLNKIDTFEDLDDAHAGMLLTCVYILLDMPEAAKKQVRKLHDQVGHFLEVSTWLDIMQAHAPEITQVSQSTLDQLAYELASQPQVIASLVAAQKIEPVREHIQTLRHALAIARHQLPTDRDTQIMICKAMADLALLCDDHEDARRWAHQGLQLNPMLADFALVLAQTADHADLGPSATTILQRVHKHYPGYPDVRAALIRREYHHGKPQSARLRLSDWLGQEPDNPFVLQLQQELAA